MFPWLPLIGGCLGHSVSQVAGSKENKTAGYDPRLNPEQRGVDHVLKGTALVRKKKRKEKERKEKMIDYKDFHT